MAESFVRGIHDARRVVGRLVHSVGELQVAWATAGRLGNPRSPFEGTARRARRERAFHATPMDVRFGI